MKYGEEILHTTAAHIERLRGDAGGRLWITTRGDSYMVAQLGDSHACGKQKFGYGDVAEGIFPLVVCLGFGMASVHGGEKCFDGVQRNGLGQYDRLTEPYLYFVEWVPVDNVFIFKIMEKGF